MKKILSSLLILSTVTFASEYYSKLEPFKTYNIKSAVSGSVIFINEDAKSKLVEKQTIVMIDSKVDKIDLQQSKIKLKSLKSVMNIEKGILESYKKVSSKSKYDKDNQKVKILNMESSISDLETQIARLEDTIDKKTLEEEGTYIYDIAVEVGNYVNPGTELYTAMDISKGKLEIYIPIDKAREIKTKTIYLNGEATDLKISKLYDVADSQHISSYKCEIIIPDAKNFSKLVKVEFK